MRRRLGSRGDSLPVPTPAHRVRPTRRLRRILARSRSAGSCTRERSQRHAYERSHSCPEYPVYTNTYKITENEKDYIFHMALSRTTPSLLTTISINREQRALPANVYYGPVPMNKIFIHPSRIKVQVQPESSNRYPEKPFSITKDNYEAYISKGIRRRKLPNVESLPNPRVRSLPEIPTVNIGNRANENAAISSSTVDFVQNYEVHSQYHGYDKDGSEAETTIHEKPNSLDLENTNSNKTSSFEASDSRQTINCIEINSVTSKISRKKLLSLDLKTNYDQKSPNQTKSLDINTFKEVVKSPKAEIVVTKVDRKEKPKIERRRNSDSLVILKSSRSSSPQDLSTPDQIKNLFKRMSITSKNTLDTSTESKAVSINEVPTFQEYRSPNSLSPQSSIDFSFKKPLPSIIKKARTRSYSLAATYHLDRQFSIMANSLSIALSPPNLGSPRRALTPVASHLPLDDSHQNIHDAAMDPSLDESAACATPQSTQPQPYYHQRDMNLYKKQSVKKRDKPPHRRNSKRSNDYGGRENGRGNGSSQQQQPLERRESRRGQFTRSLSNADVPPDDKTGKS